MKPLAIGLDIDTERLSLSERIRRDVEGRIISGEWPPGHRIPYEHQLMQHYGCARMTVNKAISTLVAAGLVVRRRRAGSFVAEPRQERAVLEIQDFLRDAARLDLPYRHSILSDRLDKLGSAECRRLGVTADARVRRIDCLHILGADVVAVERRIIMLAAVPRAAEQPFADVPPGSWLLQLVPWSRAEHVIRAVNADPDTARLLVLATGEACLVLERRTWQGEDLITDVRLTYPGNRQCFQAEFRPAVHSGR